MILGCLVVVVFLVLLEAICWDCLRGVFQLHGVYDVAFGGGLDDYSSCAGCVCFFFVRFSFFKCH